MRIRSPLTPAITLALLAPVCGELLSGSAPPVEFFQPAGFVLLLCLYGCGALLVRELAFRWSAGWSSIFLLGMAYGIFEEGILVRSFFDPTWPDLGALSVYGRWLGVNWVWAANLTIYHAAVSISLPVLLTSLIFPGQRNAPWLRRRGLVLCALLLLGTLLFAPLFSSYANPLAIGACLFAMAALAGWAYRRKRPAPGIQITARKSTLLKAGLLGFMSMAAFVAALWLLPAALPAPVSFAAALSLPILVQGALRRSRAASWTALQQWAFASGALSVWILLALVAESDPARSDNPAGMALVGLSFGLFLLWVGWRTGKIQRAAGEGQALPLSPLR